ncbi:MAG: methionyl-tRNA formyltransferase, partial [Candidatus Levyibacteriota bacterium]
MKIVFFGSGYYTIPIIEKLRDVGLVLVVTVEGEGELIDYLKKEKIPYLYSRLVNKNELSKIQDLEPDLGVLASFGAFIPKSVIESFPRGILNIHPSLLPKHKGPSPIQYTILDGIRHTGISIIKLDDQIDHGPILLQRSFLLRGKETLKSATERMFLEGADMIYEVIQKMEHGLPI